MPATSLGRILDFIRLDYQCNNVTNISENHFGMGWQPSGSKRSVRARGLLLTAACAPASTAENRFVHELDSLFAREEASGFPASIR
jgi:hypothetical protein